MSGAGQLAIEQTCLKNFGISVILLLRLSIACLIGAVYHIFHPIKLVCNIFEEASEKQ